MAATSPLFTLNEYANKTIVYKTVGDLQLKLDVAIPKKNSGSAVPVLIHYHGGFLILGDRYTFLPMWLVNACVRRRWIFVTPDYRLIPETTAHSSLEDAIDAYLWVLTSLGTETGLNIGPIIMAGSSAGAWLAFTASCHILPRPKGLLLIYGMLDPSNKRYSTKGSNIFGAPPFDTALILKRLEVSLSQPTSKVLSGYPWPEDPSQDERFSIIGALHIEALFPDYITGHQGLGEKIAAEGRDAIPSDARRLFTVAFECPADLPDTFIIHGKNDTAVPYELSLVTSEKLKRLGVKTSTQFPDDAEHGFDVRAGNIDLGDERPEEPKNPSYESLKEAIKFLEATFAT